MGEGSNEFKSYRKESKADYGTTSQELTLEQVNTGANLRIADAVEKIAQNYTKLEENLKWYKQLANDRMERINKLQRSNAALKGHIRRLQNKR